MKKYVDMSHGSQSEWMWESVCIQLTVCQKYSWHDQTYQAVYDVYLNMLAEFLLLENFLLYVVNTTCQQIIKNVI
jgi:hypothetical protein